MDEAGIGKMRRLLALYQEDRRAAGMGALSIYNEGRLHEHFIAFMAGRDEEDVTRVTADTINCYQLWIYERKGKRVERFSLSTQMQFLVSVRQFFRWMVKRGHILADPTGGVVLPRKRDTLPRVVMTQREVERLLNAPNVDAPLGLRDRAIMELLYSTGLRNAELRALTVYDVDVEEGEVRVRNGKGGKDRVVPLGEVAGSYVREYLGKVRPSLVRGEDPGFLFVSYDGKRLDSSSVLRLVWKYTEAAGIKKDVSPHTFRHTCATHMLRGHADIRHIQALLGHESLDTTQIYTRVEVGDLKRELRRCHPREQYA